MPTPLPAGSPEMRMALQCIQAQYREMPGLRLTVPQAQRLFGLNTALVAALLSVLVDTHFLHQAADGTYVRTTAR